MNKYTIVFLVLSLFSVLARAGVQTYNGDPRVLASVEGWDIPKSSFAIYFAYQSEVDDSISKHTLLKSLVMNRLLSEHALASIGAELLNDDSKVGYAGETVLQDVFSSIVRHHFRVEIKSSIAASEQGSLSTYVTHPLKLSESQLKRVLAKPAGSMLRVHALNPAQQKEAAQLQVIGFKFPKAEEQSLSLLDIYEASNIQEKISLHNADTGLLNSLAQRAMTRSYVAYWIENHSGLETFEINALKDFIYQNRVAGQFYRYQGFKAGIHDDNHRLKEVAAAVTPDEIRKYYVANKQEFKTVLRVRAQHITLDSKKKADEATKALQYGMNFSDAVRHFSVNEDRKLKVPGDLGWIERSTAKGWLNTLPFTQKVGQFSPAFMSPQKAGSNRVWEIVYVSDRDDGYFPLDSETVRYKASQAVAQQKIKGEVIGLRRQLLDKNAIGVSAEYLSAFSAEEVEDVDLFHQAHDHDHDKH